MILKNFSFTRAGIEAGRAWRMLDELCLDLRSMLNGKLTFEDNFAGGQHKIQVDTALDYTVVLASQARPVSVSVLSAKNLDTNSGRLTTGAIVEWEWRGESVLIHSISGLAANTRYEVELLVLEK
tara:strand:+ start:134 stop:508 length:375 start_codon:yes stop_codon:yes gene_type:complete